MNPNTSKARLALRVKCQRGQSNDNAANGAEMQGVIRPKPRRRMSSNAEVGAALRGIAAHTPLPPRF